jgi:hypothetical protein
MHVQGANASSPALTRSSTLSVTCARVSQSVCGTEEMCGREPSPDIVERFVIAEYPENFENPEKRENPENLDVAEVADALELWSESELSSSLGIVTVWLESWFH